MAFRRRRYTMFYLLIACLLFGIMLTAFNIYQLSYLNQMNTSNVLKHASNKKPVVWINGKHIGSGYLKHLIEVLDRVGYIYSTKSDCDWDLLWSHDYPFITLADKINKLQKYQKVNHFPGSGYITNKASLASTNISAIPIAFQIPKDKDAFLNEVKKSPTKLWVEKSNAHRGISVKNPKDIQLHYAKNSSSFVQEFVSKPLLISGRMFDIGVYTILTSVDPLRVYVFEEDVLLRFCTKDYFPFDPKDLKKYVVGDDYTPPRDIPALKEIYLKGKFTRLEALKLYLRQNGNNDLKMWNDIKDIIAEVYKLKEKNLIVASGKYHSTRNFFELVRFDFLLDEDMKVWLLEVNMSPNLSSAAHSHNKLMYEKVIFDLLSLTGVSHLTRKRTKDSLQEEKDMEVSDEDLQIKLVCASQLCLKSCQSEKCQLCNPCLDNKVKEFLQMAFQEHVNKRNYRRIYPKPMNQEMARKLSRNLTSLRVLSSSNFLMHDWFIHKCIRDATWCF